MIPKGISPECDLQGVINDIRFSFLSENYGHSLCAHLLQYGQDHVEGWSFAGVFVHANSDQL